MNPVDVTRGDSPLVLAMPHTGKWIPEDVEAKLNDRGKARADTDWHIDRLYAGLVPSATTVRCLAHRYFIDVNRDPTGASLYPGQNTTGLCPLTDFDGHPIYRDGAAPDRVEVDQRRNACHAPYHAALAAELDRVRHDHGFAILYDCHSIRSRIPFLFDAVLPDFNIGTNLGLTCHPSIESAVHDICASTSFTTVLNGRFKGGWTTREYGRPEDGLHAIQMELAQSTYMAEEPPWTYDETKATRLRRHLKTILETLTDWRSQ